MVRLEKYQLPKVKPFQEQQFLSRFRQNTNEARTETENYISRPQFSNNYFFFSVGTFVYTSRHLQDFNFRISELSNPYFALTHYFRYYRLQEDYEPIWYSYSLQSRHLHPSQTKRIRQMIVQLQVGLLLKIRNDSQAIANYVRSELAQCGCQKYKPGIQRYYQQLADKFIDQEVSVATLRVEAKEFRLKGIQDDLPGQRTDMHLFYEMKCLKAEDQKD